MKGASVPFCLKHQRLITFVKAILFIIFFRLSAYAVDHFGYYRGDNLPIGHRYAFITLMIQMLACISFISFIVQLNMKITLNDPVLRYLGNIGNEIFLVHGYFISRVFDDVRMKDFVRFGLVLICSIAITGI